MKKYILVFISFLSLSILPAQSQSYVYKSDVISAVGKESEYFNVNKTNGAVVDYTQCFKSYFYKSNLTWIVIGNNKSPDNSGIVTTASNGFLHSIDFTWYKEGTVSDAEICIKSSSEPFSDCNNLASVTDSQFFSSVFSGNSDYSVSKTFENDYRYIAIYVSDKNKPVVVKDLTLTWQLAYFRENVTEGTLNTLCLPYAIAAEDMGGLEAYSVFGKTVDSEGRAKSIVLERTESLEAGVPYVFVSNETSLALKYSYPEASAPASSNGLYGTFEEHPFAEDEKYVSGDYYVFTAEGIGAVTQEGGVHANRAFLKMSEVPTLSPEQVTSSNKALRHINLNQSETSSLSSTYAETVQHPASYSLSGCHTNKESHGVIISKGRKMLRK